MQTALKKVMTENLVIIPAGSPLKEALTIMAEKRFRHLPVVNENNEILGVILKTPLLSLQELENIPVEEAMCTQIYSIDQHAPLRQALFKFLEKKISCLIVVGKSQQVAGIITTDDLLWYLSTLLEDAKGKRFLYSSLFDLQTVGEVAQHLANIGI